MHRLGRIAITSTLLALSLHPGLARAGTAGGFVYSHYEGLSYVANAGETNDVTITGSGSTYSIHDSAGLTAGLDCTQVDATTATCESSRPSFHDISVATRDGDDIVHISSDTNTHVLGGRGDDQLFGEARAPSTARAMCSTEAPVGTRWVAHPASARSSCIRRGPPR